MTLTFYMDWNIHYMGLILTDHQIHPLCIKLLCSWNGYVHTIALVPICMMLHKF